MSYRFESGRIYRMPTHFGPAPGPRQLPPGVVADPKRSPRRLSVAASFLTEAALLERHLPDEILDVDAAVPELAAVAVGLCDFRLEGDDACEAWAELVHA